MRTAGSLLILVSLVAASLSATTAYAPKLSAVAASAVPLTLAAPAGRDPGQADKPAVAPGTARQPLRLTPDVLDRLAALNVERVRVKEFSVGRWSEAWIFGVSMLGLVAGGLLIRRETQREMLAHTADSRSGAGSPQLLLDAAYQDVRRLLAEIPALPDDRQAIEIRGQIDTIVATRLAPFAAARNELIGRYGVAGHARLMDAFAAAERQLNRAWSAAADQVLPEAITSLEDALASLDTTRTRLAELASQP
jgi:hypothetical protein